MKIRTTSVALLVAGLPMLAAGAPLMNGPSLQSAPALTSLLGELAARRALTGFDGDHGFAIASQHPGVAGTQVVRADHTYKGIRVFGSETVVVSSTAGQILSESVADRRSKLGAARQGVAEPAQSQFNVKPSLTAKEAIAIAVKSVAPAGVPLAPPRAELLVYPIMRTERVPAAVNKSEEELNALDVNEVVDSYELAYLVRTRMVVGQQPVFHDTVVSASDGHIIDQWNALQTVAGSGKSQYNGVVPLSTSADGDRFRMVDPLRGSGGKYGGMAITNADHGSEAGEVYSHNANEWGDGLQYKSGGSTTDANGQTAAVNAMWGLSNTYDMHKNVLGWQALDGQNTATYIAAHVNTNYDNAYYSDTCKCMFIGDGSSFNSLGAIDVVGHEMGHGITSSTSNLLYFGESGGLNESSSDIAGEVVEAYARAGGTGDKVPAEGNDWVLGKEISKNGTPLRYMYKPSKDGSSPDAWSSSLKRLDVHYSSGPNNRMFYFLAQGSKADKDSDFYSKYLVRKPAAMTGIGLDKAYRIWFKAATTKFNAISNYKDARAKTIAAAQELYGADSREAVAVQRAYAAINVGADVDEP
ncbi:M4 family metallopeptidase [Massilia sp. CF038]|uniref:M4 family metallopeptidase n=1 Tax=Massilia sp. CF038 TaxID=1881045 RepID=UPI000912607B|nr:M4 family metallopeptidase [Massilia sp. CF038]SHH04477.1 Zn-dependent metalloprotease [Massilia sp. CF038]